MFQRGEGAQRKIQQHVSRVTLAGLVAFCGREVGQSAAGVDFQERGCFEARTAAEIITDSRRDRADDRDLTRDRDTLVRRLEESTDRAGERIDPGNSEQGNPAPYRDLGGAGSLCQTPGLMKM